MVPNISVSIISGYFYTWEHLSLPCRLPDSSLKISDLLNCVTVNLIGQTVRCGRLTLASYSIVLSGAFIYTTVCVSASWDRL